MYKTSKKRIVATIEARMTSTRLPGKVMLPLGGKPALALLVERLKRSSYLDDVIIATTTNSTDDVLVELGNSIGAKVFRGSEDDVLSRVLGAAKKFDADIIVEITGDCPLVDHRLVDRGIEEFFESGADYAANIIPSTYPDGFDVQVFSTDILEKTSRLTNDPIDRVHVSIYIRNHPEIFHLHNWEAEAVDFAPGLRVSLDEKADYELICKVFEILSPENPDFGAHEVVSLLKSDPSLTQINKQVRVKDVEEG